MKAEVCDVMQTNGTETISVGVARADITPPVGCKSVGFAGRAPLSRLHDPLVATALVFADGDRMAALIGCDLLGLNAETVAEVRQEIHRQVGISPDAVTVACTHTHYGPDAYRDRSDPRVTAYRANLIHILAGLVREAASARRPALLGVGWGESTIGVNRREKLPDGRVILGQNPKGPIDRAVGVLRIDALAGDPIACVVNFQTHPVSQTGGVDHISADYPGKMREVVEALTGATCLFTQGACGNINAAIMKPDYESARTLGTRLGCEVVGTWETIAPQATSGLSAISSPIQLPRIRYGSKDQVSTLIASLRDEISRLQAEGTSAGRIYWAEHRLERALEALESWESGVLPEPVTSEIQACRIGAFAFVTAPGEIFNQIGVAVKDSSPFEDTFFVGYANDSIGYVPIPEAYADGGYEVTHASQVDPGAAGVLVAGCGELLERLAGRGDYRGSFGPHGSRLPGIGDQTIPEKLATCRPGIDKLFNRRSLAVCRSNRL